MILSLSLPALARPTTEPDPQPPTAVERANADAVERLYTRVCAERIDSVRVSELLDRVEGHAGVIYGLSQAEQIGGPRVIAEGVVQVTLEISGPRVAGLIADAVALHPDRTAITAKRLRTLSNDWAERTFRSTGDSVAKGDRGTTTPPPPIDAPAVDAPHDEAPATQVDGRPTLPDVAPDWTSDAITAAGVSVAVGTPLRTARAAEKTARQRLRDEVAALKLDETRTLASLASLDTKAAAAIAAAIDVARISNVDYRSDGTVEVTVSTDGRQLWRALQRSLLPR